MFSQYRTICEASPVVKLYTAKNNLSDRYTLLTRKQAAMHTFLSIFLLRNFHRLFRYKSLYHTKLRCLTFTKARPLNQISWQKTNHFIKLLLKHFPFY